MWLSLASVDIHLHTKCIRTYLTIWIRLRGPITRNRGRRSSVWEQFQDIGLISVLRAYHTRPAETGHATKTRKNEGCLATGKTMRRRLSQKKADNTRIEAWGVLARFLFCFNCCHMLLPQISHSTGVKGKHQAQVLKTLNTSWARERMLLCSPPGGAR